jgi:hypothetical protein
MGRHRDRRGAAARESALQLEGEEEVGELALPIGPPGPVGALALEVVEANAPDAVHGAAHGHHPRARGRQQQVQQEPGQREVAEVVGAELHLEAVGREGARDRHDPGVVHQQVQGGVALAEGVGEGAHGGEAREVQGERLHRIRRGREGGDLLLGGARLLGIAAGQHHAGAAPRERPRGLEPEPAVRSRHDRHAPVERRHVVRGPAFLHRGPILQPAPEAPRQPW